MKKKQKFYIYKCNNGGCQNWGKNEFLGSIILFFGILERCTSIFKLKRTQKNQKKKKFPRQKTKKKILLCGQDLFFLILFLILFLVLFCFSGGDSLCKFESNFFYFFFSILTPTNMKLQVKTKTLCANKSEKFMLVNNIRM